MSSIPVSWVCREGPDEPHGPLVLSAEVEVAGQRYQMHVGDLQLHINEMTMEARSITYLVDIAKGMRAAMEANLPKLEEARRAGGHSDS